MSEFEINQWNQHLIPKDNDADDDDDEYPDKDKDTYRSIDNDDDEEEGDSYPIRTDADRFEESRDFFEED